MVGPSIESRSVGGIELPRALSFRSAVEGLLSQGAMPEETPPGVEGLIGFCGRGDTGVLPVLTGRVAVLG